MSDQLPSPEFDRTRYERPNDAWICGHACDGKPCRLGPSPKGECPAAAECRPVLDTIPGETKGRWRCTRPKEHGGPCGDGPRPDGGCGCPVIRCAPQRSLRNLRGRFTAVVAATTLAILLLAVGGAWRWRFLTPAIVSQPHQGGAFAALAHQRLGSANECGACHGAANMGIAGWAGTALVGNRGILSTRQFDTISPGVVPMTAIDRQSCAVCHDEHGFHQPNVVESHSCSVCHTEHNGLAMPAPQDSQCAHCHNSPAVMLASSAKGLGMASEAFDPPVKKGRSAFRTPRPAGGRTNLFSAFWQGHPEFGVRVQHLKEQDTLKFTHALHLGASVRWNGKPLDCADCHAPDPTGAYMARIRYDQHCAKCHDLQFDPAHPEMKLPHGEVAAVRAKLRGLPVLYAELKTGELDAAGRAPLKEEVDAFAQENLARMRRTFGSGETLEKLVLFAADPRQSRPGLSAERRAHYAGCAYCHEVKPDAVVMAKVTTPVIPDRWLLSGRFHHGKHAQQNCEECHSVRGSHSTADINLPSQASCAVCHRPGGSGPAGCAVCHTFHLHRKE